MQSSFKFVPDIPPDIYKSHLNISNSNDLQTRPLWATKFAQYDTFKTNCQREYFQIEILTDKTEDEDILLNKNMDDVLNMNKYMCHICNVEVPRTYIKEHKNSIKHVTCSNIANLALERIKLQMQLDLPVIRKVEILETYFCDHCSVVVFDADKEKHEKSISHKISLKHDEQLLNLYKIYSNIDNVKVDLEADVLIKESVILRSIENDEQNMQNEEDNLEIVEDELLEGGEKLISTQIELQVSEDDKEQSEILEDTFTKEMKKLDSIQQELNKLRNSQVDTGTDEDEMTEECQKFECTEDKSENYEKILDFVKSEELQDVEDITNLKTEEDMLLFVGTKLDEYAQSMTDLLSHCEDTKDFQDLYQKAGKKLDALKFALLYLENMKNTLNIESTSEIDKPLELLKRQLTDLEETYINCLKHENNNVKGKANLNDHKNDSSNKVDVVPRVSRNARKRANKKYKLLKQKECFSNEHTLEIDVNIDPNQKNIIDTPKYNDLNTNNLQEAMIKEENDDTCKIIEKENDNEKVIIKDDSLAIKNDDLVKNKDSFNDKDDANVIDEAEIEIKASDNNDNDTKQMIDKIDAIIAKFFHSTCTVDALNNVQDDKNKQTSKEKIKKRKHKKTNIKNHDKESLKNFDLNESVEENNNIKDIQPTKKNKKEKVNVKDNIEQMNVKDQHIDQTKNNKKTTRNLEQNTKEQIDKKDQKKNKAETRNKKTKNQKEHLAKDKNLLETNKNHKPNFNLVYYLKDISRRCDTKPIHTVEAITDNIVQITAINGDKIRVLVNNFHSFHVKANDIYCKVCESPNVRRMEWHIAENEHRAKVMIPVNDLNGIRQLDDIWSHCILCNDLTKNIEFHLQTIMHKNKVKHCLFELGKADSDEDNEHTNKLHYIRFKESEITNIMQENNLVLTKRNYLKCVICDVIVNYNLTRVMQHVISFEHLNKLEEQQQMNKLFVIDDDIFYCIPCDVNILKSRTFLHCNGKRHRKFLKEFLIKNGEEIKDSGDEVVLETIAQCVKKSDGGYKIEDSELICFVCNKIIYCIEEHTNTFDHKKMYYAYLERNKLNEIEIDTFFCIPCNTTITIDYLMSHCTSRKHRQKINNLNGIGDDITEPVAEIKLSTPEIPTEPNSNDNRKLRLKILYQFKQITDPNKLLCTVCDEEILYSKKYAENHINTLDHVVAFNLMMLWNKIKKRDDKYFCDICCLDMTYFSEISHVLSKQHANNLAKEAKGTVYEYDSTLVTHGYAMSLKVGDRYNVGNIFC